MLGVNLASAMFFIQVKVINPDGEIVKVGEKGELLHTGLYAYDRLLGGQEKDRRKL